MLSVQNLMAYFKGLLCSGNPSLAFSGRKTQAGATEVYGRGSEIKLNWFFSHDKTELIHF